jgi:hypothetical protein
MTKDEKLAMDLALEALEMVVVDVKTTPTAYEAHRRAITAIKQARSAQQEHEPENEPHVSLAPVQDTEAHYKGVVEGVQKLFDDKRAQPAPVQELVAQCTVDVSGAAGPSCEPLNWHKTAAQRQWVGLTDEEITDEFYKFEAAGAWYQFARAIEAKLREKNT